MGWHTYTGAVVLNWAIGVDASEEVDDVDEDPEDGGGAYSPIQARCPASSFERARAKGTVVLLGIGNVEPTTDFDDVYTEDVVDTGREGKAECYMLGLG